MMTLEERLISESQTLIERVRESVRDDSPAGGAFHPPGRRHPETNRDEPVDGSVELSLSADAMTVFASFYPPQNSGEPLEPADVYEKLSELGVTYGVQSEAVESVLFTCNTEQSALHAIEIAFGEPPQDAVPAHLELVPTNDAATPNNLSETSDRVDHRERSSLRLVQEGDLLATTMAAGEGVMGRTVTGEEIPFRTVEVPSLRCGDNIVETGSEVRAAIGGVLHVEEGVIAVSPTLVLDSGVDYHTGNINFEGDVILNGTVGDGFTIRCTGALATKKTLDSFGITCGTLTCAQGLIGRNDEPTVVVEDAHARFVQNARLVVGGSLSISQSALKAHATASDRIELGPGSTVIASTLRAGLGISAHTIGAPGAAISEIYIGIDFDVDERLATIRDQTVALTEKLRDMRLTRKHGHDTKDLRTLEEQMEAAITMLADQSSDLVSRLDRNEEAELVVRGTIHAGTYIEICHRSYIVESTVAYRRFRLDKARGVIASEPLHHQGG